MNQHPYPSLGVLLVDDEQAWLRSLSMTLEGPGGISNLQLCRDSREVLDILAARDIGLVLLDLTMPHLSGEELLPKILEKHPEVAVIIVSGMNQVETAVRCMRLGAFDYFVKTAEEDRILDGVRRAIRLQELERENRSLRRRVLSDALEHPEVFAGIVTDDRGMQAIFKYIESVAGSSQPILITGESGTGKELIARAAHELSGRSGPLVAMNAAGLDDSVFADTLFGHSRGAFTGAETARGGMVERAADGTLFLDEIGDLSPASQVKLLRLLQEGEYYPLGSDIPKTSRARIVVATHQDLADREAGGHFRRDLYYRLRGHHVHLPPLRQRKEDIPLLFDHFLEEAAASLGRKKPTPPRQLPVVLATYDFPGNIRELRSMVYDAVSTHPGGILSMNSFLKAMGRTEGAQENAATEEGENPFAGLTRLPYMTEALDLLIAEAMRRTDGNQTAASRLLGISQPALSKRLKHSRE
ncbi:sigma-54 dependent transcriptional regulator [Desulfuromonas sp. TF]|uniref:sigma-54-dependent transcriptional regulator n=1 Tax=Desulfuromonas sp. TF TaxID=1232410 RepID=UPI00040D90D1|nr:sigma-54 dependent transcriptional regulator [Desulfuromonas sp. TF]